MRKDHFKTSVLFISSDRDHHINVQYSAPYLENVVISREVHGADVNVDVVVVEELLGQLLDLFGPGSRPHHHLSVRSDLLKDLPYLRLKSHIQHPVGLVQTEIGCPPQVDLPSLEEINESAGSSNADLHAILNIP